MSGFSHQTVMGVAALLLKWYVHMPRRMRQVICYQAGSTWLPLPRQCSGWWPLGNFLCCVWAEHILFDNSWNCDFYVYMFQDLCDFSQKTQFAYDMEICCGDPVIKYSHNIQVFGILPWWVAPTSQLNALLSNISKSLCFPSSPTACHFLPQQPSPQHSELQSKILATFFNSWINYCKSRNASTWQLFSSSLFAFTLKHPPIDAQQHKDIVPRHHISLKESQCHSFFTLFTLFTLLAQQSLSETVI